MVERGEEWIETHSVCLSSGEVAGRVRSDGSERLAVGFGTCDGLRPRVVFVLRERPRLLQGSSARWRHHLALHQYKRGMVPRVWGRWTRRRMERKKNGGKRGGREFGTWEDAMNVVDSGEGCHCHVRQEDAGRNGSGRWGGRGR